MITNHRIVRRSLASALTLLVTLAIAACSTTEHTTIPPSAQSAALSFDDAGDRPPTARTLYAYARMLSAGGKDAQAATVLASCIRDYPDFPPAYVAMAELHLRNRRFDDAIAVLEHAIARIPGDPILHCDLGMCFLATQNYELALEEFATAAAFSPSDGRYYGNVALANALLGRYDEALAVYQNVVPLGEAHYNVAVICEARGDHARAQHEYAMAESLYYHGPARSESK